MQRRDAGECFEKLQSERSGALRWDKEDFAMNCFELDQVKQRFPELFVNNFGSDSG